nr:YitT family protein [Microbacterium amylolyticum]
MSILFGAFIVSLGLFILRAGGDVTGGTAGLSLLLSYVVPISFGMIFFLVNLPFFLLAIRDKGWSFTIRSGISVALVSLFSAVHGMTGFFSGLELNPFYAAVTGAILAGVGVLMVFRHNSSLGGFNIIALVLQERFARVRAGYVLMVLDACVVLGAFFVADWPHVLASAIGAIVMNLILALNHRPGRYVGA